MAKKDEKKFEKPDFDYETFNSLLNKMKSWGKSEPLYKSLFYEGDIAMLIGPPCSGKSHFALMIAEWLCEKYEKTRGDYFRVFYYDLDMGVFQYRYRLWDGKSEKTHKFSEQLVRVRIHEDHRHKFTEDIMLGLLGNELADWNGVVTTIIIDNFSYFSKNKSGASAAAFLQNLKILRDHTLVTFLILAHTKNKNGWKPITLADIKGSDYLSTIPDSIFALNMSRKGEDIRYLKQLKSRNSELEYGADNVIEYKIERDSEGVVRLKYQGNTTEEEQLDIDYESKQNLENKLLCLQKLTAVNAQKGKREHKRG